jgi:hypothetical protein
MEDSLMYNLDSKTDFDQYMLEWYGKLFPSGKMTVYNTHPEPTADGGTTMVANSDSSWTEWELPILVALKTQMVSKDVSVYENNWKLYQRNCSPDNRSRVIPLEHTGITVEKQLEILEGRVRDLEIKAQ